MQSNYLGAKIITIKAQLPNDEWRGLSSREVNEMLGKHIICSILSARRESDTFPARREAEKKRV